MVPVRRRDDSDVRPDGLRSSHTLEALVLEDAQELPRRDRRRLSDSDELEEQERRDVTECPVCGNKMKIIAALTAALAIRTYLDGVGLASRPPPIAPSVFPAS